jgi:hypothetical protein
VAADSGLPPEGKVGAWLRASDVFAPSGKPVTPRRSSPGRFPEAVRARHRCPVLGDRDRPPGPGHFGAGEGRVFSEDANLHRVGPEATGRRLQADREAQAEPERKAEKSDPLVASPASGRTEQRQPARRKTPSVAEPQPGPKQQEISGPQRSDTPDGLAPRRTPGSTSLTFARRTWQEHPAASSHGDGGCDGQGPRRDGPSASRRTFPLPPRSGRTPRRGRRSRSRRSGAPRFRSATTRRRTGQGDAPAEKAEENVVKPKGDPVKKTTRTGTAKRPSRNKS